MNRKDLAAIESKVASLVSRLDDLNHEELLAQLDDIVGNVVDASTNRFIDLSKCPGNVAFDLGALYVVVSYRLGRDFCSKALHNLHNAFSKPTI
jgi:hypothetical protein